MPLRKVFLAGLAAERLAKGSTKHIELSISKPTQQTVIGMTIGLGGRGVEISSVSKDTAAYKAGLRVGDVLMRVHGEPCIAPEQTSAIFLNAVGTIRVAIVRQPPELTRPSSGGSSGNSVTFQESGTGRDSRAAGRDSHGAGRDSHAAKTPRPTTSRDSEGRPLSRETSRTPGSSPHHSRGRNLTQRVSMDSIVAQQQLEQEDSSRELMEMVKRAVVVVQQQTGELPTAKEIDSTMSLRELKALIASVGFSADGIVEKAELRKLAHEAVIVIQANRQAPDSPRTPRTPKEAPPAEAPADEAPASEIPAEATAEATNGSHCGGHTTAGPTTTTTTAVAVPTLARGAASAQSVFKHCTQCGARSENANFCPACGAPIRERRGVEMTEHVLEVVDARVGAFSMLPKLRGDVQTWAAALRADLPKLAGAKSVDEYDDALQHAAQLLGVYTQAVDELHVNLTAAAADLRAERERSERERSERERSSPDALPNVERPHQPAIHAHCGRQQQQQRSTSFVSDGDEPPDTIRSESASTVRTESVVGELKELRNEKPAISFTSSRFSAEL